MKKSLILITILSVSSASAGQFNVCYQHDVSVGVVRSASNDEAVLGQLCFNKHGGNPESISAEGEAHPVPASNNQYSPECWKGKKEDIIGNEGGN